MIEVGVLTLCAAAGTALVRGGTIPARSLALFLGGFAFAMVFLTPDLDLVRSRPTRHWGPFSFLWWPYAKLFRHRGISHHLVWGPLSRIAYLFLLAVGAAAALGRPLSLTAPHADAWAILAGLYAPNMVHSMADAARSRRSRRT